MDTAKAHKDFDIIGSLSKCGPAKEADQSQTRIYKDSCKDALKTLLSLDTTQCYVQDIKLTEGSLNVKFRTTDPTSLHSTLYSHRNELEHFQCYGTTVAFRISGSFVQNSYMVLHAMQILTVNMALLTAAPPTKRSRDSETTDTEMEVASPRRGRKGQQKSASEGSSRKKKTPNAPKTQDTATGNGNLPNVHQKSNETTKDGVMDEERASGASLVRPAPRSFVESISSGVSDEALMAFFNQTMTQPNITTGAGDPVMAAQIDHEKEYALCEFTTPEEATPAMALDGIQIAGQSLKIRKPEDYQPAGGDSDAPMAIQDPGVVSTNVPDSVNKIFAGGLPINLNDDEVMQLLKSFGELRSFNLVKDAQTGASKGFAFCEYVDPAITDIACQGLNGMELADKKLVVQRASLGAKKIGSGASMPLTLPHTLLAGEREVMPSKVLMLLNMVTPAELVSQGSYDEIMEYIQEEAAKYGTVKQVKIPQPIAGQEVHGVGKVFIQYTNEEEAGTALKALAGRTYADRTVVTSYWNEDKYLTDDLEGLPSNVTMDRHNPEVKDEVSNASSKKRPRLLVDSDADGSDNDGDEDAKLRSTPSSRPARKSRKLDPIAPPEPKEGVMMVPEAEDGPVETRFSIENQEVGMVVLAENDDDNEVEGPREKDGDAEQLEAPAVLPGTVVNIAAPASGASTASPAAAKPLQFPYTPLAGWVKPNRWPWVRKPFPRRENFTPAPGIVERPCVTDEDFQIEYLRKVNKPGYDTFRDALYERLGRWE